VEKRSEPRSTRSRTCVVADAHPGIVESVSRLLSETGEFDIVATAVDGLDALQRIERHRPELAVVDAAMPGLDGIEIVRRVASASAGTRVLVYSGRRDAALVLEALEAGAAGFVFKGGELADLAQAAAVVAAGGTYVEPEIAAALNGPRSRRPQLLTRREREALRLLAEGYRNDEVAERLQISPLTVRTHVRHAMEKLNASTRTEAVATALRLSLIR
jgi:two-component system nitrate/nitrite response regulator NarL